MTPRQRTARLARIDAMNAVADALELTHDVADQLRAGKLADEQQIEQATEALRRALAAVQAQRRAAEPALRLVG